MGFLDVDIKRKALQAALGMGVTAAAAAGIALTPEDAEAARISDLANVAKAAARVPEKFLDVDMPAFNAKGIFDALYGNKTESLANTNLPAGPARWARDAWDVSQGDQEDLIQRLKDTAIEQMTRANKNQMARNFAAQEINKLRVLPEDAVSRINDVYTSPAAEPGIFGRYHVLPQDIQVFSPMLEDTATGLKTRIPDVKTAVSTIAHEVTHHVAEEKGLGYLGIYGANEEDPTKLVDAVINQLPQEIKGTIEFSSAKKKDITSALSSIFKNPDDAVEVIKTLQTATGAVAYDLAELVALAGEATVAKSLPVGDPLTNKIEKFGKAFLGISPAILAGLSTVLTLPSIGDYTGADTSEAATIKFPGRKTVADAAGGWLQNEKTPLELVWSKLSGQKVKLPDTLLHISKNADQLAASGIDPSKFSYHTEDYKPLAFYTGTSKKWLPSQVTGDYPTSTKGLEAYYPETKEGKVGLMNVKANLDKERVLITSEKELRDNYDKFASAFVKPPEPTYTDQEGMTMDEVSNWFAGLDASPHAALVKQREEWTNLLKKQFDAVIITDADKTNISNGLETLRLQLSNARETPDIGIPGVEKPSKVYEQTLKKLHDLTKLSKGIPEVLILNPSNTIEDIALKAKWPLFSIAALGAGAATLGTPDESEAMPRPILDASTNTAKKVMTGNWPKTARDSGVMKEAWKYTFPSGPYQGETIDTITRTPSKKVWYLGFKSGNVGRIDQEEAELLAKNLGIHRYMRKFEDAPPIEQKIQATGSAVTRAESAKELSKTMADELKKSAAESVMPEDTVQPPPKLSGLDRVKAAKTAPEPPQAFIPATPIERLTKVHDLGLNIQPYTQVKYKGTIIELPTPYANFLLEKGIVERL